MADTVLTYEYNNVSKTYSVIGATSIADDGALTIPETYNDNTNGEHPVVSIGNGAFSDCYTLTSITIPDSIISIGDNAFLNCTSLTSIAIPDSVINIGSLVCSGCTSLASVTIPNSITSIGELAFNYCTSLTSITIPDSFTNIGSYMFSYCTSLTSVTIPDSITSIGEGAFFTCSALTNIIIPDGVTSIGEGAFYDCTSLKSITIPNSITSIGDYAFVNCNKLEKVYYTGSKEKWNSYTTQSSVLASESIKIYNEIHDCDFLAFTFNGYHSLLDLNIIRTSDGDRYNHDLTPQIKDMTAENTGGDGMYYFKTNYPTRQFNISFAFDSLTEQQIRKLKQVFSVKELCDLIFDEEPYKVWTAKVTGTPTIKYIPFDDKDGQRVYRGEGSVQFTAYWPFSHTPNTNTKISKKFRASGTFEKNGLLFEEYDEWLYPTRNQWKLASGLKESGTVGVGENYGDLVATFILSKSTETNSGSVLKVGDLEITLQDKVYKLKWDSKTGIVSGTNSDGEENTRKPVPFSGNSLGGIPVGDSITWGLKENTTPISYSTTNCTLTYHYWYY